MTLISTSMIPLNLFMEIILSLTWHIYYHSYTIYSFISYRISITHRDLITSILCFLLLFTGVYTWAYLKSIPESNFKTIIITTFILILTWLYWPGSIRVDPPNLWPGLCPESTSKLGFKITIIIIFVFLLNWVNGERKQWLVPCPRSTIELDFTTLIVTIFIITLTWVNKDHKSYSKSTPKLSFKTMIITIFILICLS